MIEPNDPEGSGNWGVAEVPGGAYNWGGIWWGMYNPVSYTHLYYGDEENIHTCAGAFDDC